MKRIMFVLAALLLLSRAAVAQVLDTQYLSAASADCSTAGSCATFDVANAPSVTVTISGTFSETLIFEGTADGTTWNAVEMANVATSVCDTAGSAATFAVQNAGLLRLRVRASAYVSGLAKVVATRGMGGGPVCADISSVGTAVTPGTGATNLGKAEDAALTSGDTGVFVLGVVDATNTTQRAAAGDYSQITVDEFGTLLARSDHPRRFHCTVTVSTATTIQAVGGSCAAPGASLSLYVTDVMFSASASGIAADAFPTLKYGTGGTCGAGTAVFWQALSAAAIVVQDNRTIPIKIPANNEICWITSTAGSKAIQISGFIAP